MGYTPPQLEVRKITAPSVGYSIMPPNATTTDDLYIYANTTDAKPFVSLLGGAGITLLVNTNYTFRVSDFTIGDIFVVSHATPDIVLATTANKNLWLKAQGTGKLKVSGTATGTGDVAINGHFDILDEAGATIKLATVA